MRLGSILVLLFFSVGLKKVAAQPPQRFIGEVESLLKTPERDAEYPLLLLTGSSSIRMWPGLPAYFPGYQVYNMGFGGSQMSDLLFFLDVLVLMHQPDEILIYEGDNDLAAGERVGKVVRETKAVLLSIEERLPGVPVVLIAAKPSPARWTLRKQYERLNRRLQRLAARWEGVAFADVWNVMLNAAGEPEPSIFLEDQLHLNAAGYDRWIEVIQPLLTSSEKK